MKEPDAETVAQAKGGDPQAFRAIVVAYQDHVHRLLARMLAGVVPRAEIDDLAQETFLRVHQALPGFTPEGPGRLTRWIITIATRLGIDALRRSRLREVPLDETALGPAEGLGGIASDPATLEYLSSAMAQAIASLPVEQRSVFMLRDYFELDYADIAAVLGIELGTVKSRLSRARAALRKILSATGGSA